MSDNIILKMENIDKVFPGVRALDGVDLEVKECEIHGLIGENGAGKSTLMKILSGLYTHDGGTITFCGKEYKKLDPKLVEQIGISIIHQERQVVPYLTVAESLFLGIEPQKLMHRKTMVKNAEKLLEEKLGVSIKGSALMSELTVGEQQLVQICRALMTNPKLIIFDEPTAVLAQKEAQKLFEIIRELKKTISVIYISHYFGEILDLCDAITVLKNGQKVTTVQAEGETIEHLVYLMVGRDVKDQYPPKTRTFGEEVIKVAGLTHKKLFQDVSFSIRAGEIVGLTGLMGSGHGEVGECLYNTKDVVSGTIEYMGQPVKRLSHESAVKMGIGYLPEDRRGKGVIQADSVKENITIASMQKVSKCGFINRKAENKVADEYIKSLSIKTPSREEISGLLSGGNQQKVIIARWMQCGSKLLILNQPTSGVDIGARADIYSFIDEMARKGSAVLLISQDIQELVGMSDRILTMFRGRLTGEFDVDKDITDDVIVSMMGGGKSES